MSTVITKSDAIQALVSNLAAEMLRKNMSQSDLARSLFGDNLHVNDRMKVSRWCNGKAFPDLVDLANMAEIFGCTIDHLLSLKLPRKKIS